MITAVPLNSKGEVAGEPKNFPDAQFLKMKKTFGKNLAWKELDKSNDSTVVELKPDAVSTKGAKSKTTITETEIIKEIVPPNTDKPTLTEGRTWKTKKNK